MSQREAIEVADRDQTSQTHGCLVRHRNLILFFKWETIKKDGKPKKKKKKRWETIAEEEMSNLLYDRFLGCWSVNLLEGRGGQSRRKENSRCHYSSTGARCWRTWHWQP